MSDAKARIDQAPSACRPVQPAVEVLPAAPTAVQATPEMPLDVPWLATGSSLATMDRVHTLNLQVDQGYLLWLLA